MNAPYSDHRAIRQGQDHDIHAVWVEALPDIVGEIKDLAIEANVHFIPIPGYWLYRTGEKGADGSVEPARDGKKVLYSMH